MSDEQPRIGLDDDGTLDDFAADNVELIHFEAIDQSRWYLTVVLEGGDVWQLNFGAVNPSAKGYARAELVEHNYRTA